MCLTSSVQMEVHLPAAHRQEVRYCQSDGVRSLCFSPSQRTVRPETMYNRDQIRRDEKKTSSPGALHGASEPESFVASLTGDTLYTSSLDRPSTASRSAMRTTSARVSEAKPRKRAHYLRHSQRCSIIERINAGEQQAALAREFKVTRAAISHIYKNREEIMARVVEDESYARFYEEVYRAADDFVLCCREEEEEEEDLSEYSDVSTAVTEICDNAVLLLLTTLRDARSDPSFFHRAATRLITLVLEEAIAILGAHPVERIGEAGERYRGLEREQEFCGVALNDDAVPLAVILNQMEPQSPVGASALMPSLSCGLLLAKMLISDNDGRID